MAYFYKKIRNGQVYIYSARTDENGKKVHEYIGNVNNLPEGVADIINEYFSESDYKKNFLNDHNYDLLTEKTLTTVIKKFGEMWLIYEIEKNIGLVKMIDEKLVNRIRKDNLSIGYFFYSLRSIE